MNHYFKRNWKKIALVCAVGLLCEGLYVIAQMVMMQGFDAAINLDFRGFLVWTAVNLGVYCLYLAMAALEGVLEARAVRVMNNQVRHDLYLSLLSKPHSQYHSQDFGRVINKGGCSDMGAVHGQPFSGVIFHCWIVPSEYGLVNLALGLGQLFRQFLWCPPIDGNVVSIGILDPLAVSAQFLDILIRWFFWSGH